MDPFPRPSSVPREKKLAGPAAARRCHGLGAVASRPYPATKIVRAAWSVIGSGALRRYGPRVQPNRSTIRSSSNRRPLPVQGCLERQFASRLGAQRKRHIGVGTVEVHYVHGQGTQAAQRFPFKVKSSGCRRARRDFLFASFSAWIVLATSRSFWRTISPPRPSARMINRGSLSAGAPSLSGLCT